jgi:hypothetical protein
LQVFPPRRFWRDGTLPSKQTQMQFIKGKCPTFELTRCFAHLQDARIAWKMLPG